MHQEREERSRAGVRRRKATIAKKKTASAAARIVDIGGHARTGHIHPGCPGALQVQYTKSLLFYPNFGGETRVLLPERIFRHGYNRFRANVFG